MIWPLFVLLSFLGVWQVGRGVLLCLYSVWCIVVGPPRRDPIHDLDIKAFADRRIREIEDSRRQR